MLKRFFRRGTPETVEITDAGVTRTLRDGGIEAITWDALTEVRILTTADGPWAEDVFWVLVAGEEGCLVPQSQTTDAMVKRLQDLPGFDHNAMIEAMGSASEAEFVCWRAG